MNRAHSTASDPGEHESSPNIYSTAVLVAERAVADLLEAMNLWKSETEELAYKSKYLAVLECNSNVNCYVSMESEARDRSPSSVSNWSSIGDGSEARYHSANNSRAAPSPVVVHADNDSAKPWDSYNVSAVESSSKCWSNP